MSVCRIESCHLPKHVTAQNVFFSLFKVTVPFNKDPHFKNLQNSFINELSSFISLAIFLCLVLLLIEAVRPIIGSKN